MRRTIVVAVALLVSLAGTVPAVAETEEGIKVHGHWKIEVLDADGTLVSVTEFNNALVDAPSLALILMGDSVVGSMAVYLYGPSNGTHPCDNSGTPWFCEITEAGSDWLSTPHSSNLVLTYQAGSVVLSGSVTAANATTIGSVYTWIKRCDTAVTPSDCFSLAGPWVGSQFTTATLASPPTVAVGQIIQVTVTISFS